MNIAFCYESVLPSKGGCETYISDLSRRLLQDRHEVHLYACRWDEQALDARVIRHALPALNGPRFLKPWRFGRNCLDAMSNQGHDVTIGFDKTWGQDVLYPQGGLHLASADYNLRKFRSPVVRTMARALKCCDLAAYSFRRLERKQYLALPRPTVVVNSYMVRDHFRHYYDIPAENLHVVRSSIDPARFPEHDRLKVRLDWRAQWRIDPGAPVALMAAMNYRLKGLDPLLHAVPHVLKKHPNFRLLVVGNPKTGSYDKLAKRLGIDRAVTFAGHCPTMRHAYFASDFLVHPTFYDPCSLVALEALGCGLPVITTRYNGASELMHEGREGYLIDDPHQHEHMAGAMIALCEPRKRLECSHAARKAAAQWTFEQHYRDLVAVFQQAAARKKVA